AIFLCRHDGRLGRDSTRYARGLLGPDELSRYERTGHAGKKVQYLLSRALIKTVGSRLLGRPTAEISLSGGVDGRPRIRGEAQAAISISYSTGVVAAAFGMEGETGLDIEKIREAPLGVAKRYFSPAELAAITAAEDPAAVFYRLWTLKESFAKYTGAGIFKTLRWAWFDLSGPDGKARLIGEHGGGDIFFYSGMTGDGFMLALASSKPDAPVLYRCEPEIFLPA
ncbi:MAG TPA: 4'-phosphopantetheinyl transferase superfamily protein, partial [Spirochaetes bacterium]|nr:4'-phosphopantetheinyl transferase superfamily protein [Spirochaetota bacterium]